MKDDKILCDNCENYEVHPSGVSQICHAQKQGSVVIAWLTDYYRDRRFDGIAESCKGFYPIRRKL